MIIIFILLVILTPSQVLARDFKVSRKLQYREELSNLTHYFDREDDYVKIKIKRYPRKWVPLYGLARKKGNRCIAYVSDKYGKHETILTALHEIGHCYGYEHNNSNRDSIMCQGIHDAERRIELNIW